MLNKTHSELNLYCDESCHLRTDKIDKRLPYDNYMAIGCIWCPQELAVELNREIRNIKDKYNYHSELKWVKISTSKVELAKSLIDYFFSNPNLHFRVYLIKNKYDLKHEEYNQTADEFYYKTHFRLIETVIFNSRPSELNVYLDKKDTLSTYKYQKLFDYLNNRFNSTNGKVKKVQQVVSSEIEMMQILDLFLGMITYCYRGLDTSKAKLELVNYVQDTHNINFKERTRKTEAKFNLFDWDPNYQK